MSTRFNKSRHRRHVIAGVGAGVLAACAGVGLPRAQAEAWRPDGAGVSGRLGVLTPHFDPVPETEMAAMASAGVSLHAARVLWTGGARAFAEPPHVDEATGELAGEGPRNLNPDAILFAFTSSSYALGADGDALVRARLEQRSRGIPVILTCDAAVAAFRVLSARKIALFHPPWFSEQVCEQGRVYFAAQGFDVVRSMPLAPSRSFTEVKPEEVFAFVSEHAPASADAVAVLGNGMRVAGAIAALEERLGKPVISANQVLLWEGLRRIGQAKRVQGYGSIFQRG